MAESRADSYTHPAAKTVVNFQDLINVIFENQLDHGKNASEITLMPPNDNRLHKLEIGKKKKKSGSPINKLWICYIFFMKWIKV